MLPESSCGSRSGPATDLDDGGDSSDRSGGFVLEGTAEVALREKRPAFDNDIARDPEIGPDALSIRRAAVRLGAKSVIVLPLIVEGKTFGILTLYAPERNFFDDEELKLLTELPGHFVRAGVHCQGREGQLSRLLRSADRAPNRTLFSERLVSTYTPCRQSGAGGGGTDRRRAPANDQRHVEPPRGRRVAPSDRPPPGVQCDDDPLFQPGSRGGGTASR